MVTCGFWSWSREATSKVVTQPVSCNQQCASESEKFIYEQRYEFEHTRTTNLDNKASNLVGWIGLISSVLSISSGILFSQG